MTFGAAQTSARRNQITEPLAELARFQRAGDPSNVYSGVNLAAAETAYRAGLSAAGRNRALSEAQSQAARQTIAAAQQLAAAELALTEPTSIALPGSIGPAAPALGGVSSYGSLYSYYGSPSHFTWVSGDVGFYTYWGSWSYDWGYYESDWGGGSGGEGQFGSDGYYGGSVCQHAHIVLTLLGRLVRNSGAAYGQCMGSLPASGGCRHMRRTRLPELIDRWRATFPMRRSSRQRMS